MPDGCRHNLLVTGPARIGKTTVVQKVLALLKTGFGGYYTQAADPSAMRTDYRLVTVDGKDRSLAHSTLIRHFQAPGAMGIFREELEERGIEALRGAMARYPLIVIDEIGRLEVYVPNLRHWIRKALDGPSVVLGTLPVSRDASDEDEGERFLAQVRHRPGVRLFEVTAANRSVLPAELANAICDLLGPPSSWRIAKVDD